MRMKNRFHRMGKSLLGAMCLLSVGSLTYSCSDDYDLDEKMPSYLGESIYGELKARNNYTTVVRLIEDLNKKDELSKTGSKTIFAADDQAYQEFFASVDWIGVDGNKVREYSQLTTAQKKLLLNSCMLNNAYVLEMLSNTEGGGKNLCLRQVCSAATLDSVPFWNWQDLPENLNVGEIDAEGNSTGDKRFWDYYRRPARGGIYMVMDKTAPMMTHFLEGQMNEKSIKHRDVAFIVSGGANSDWAEGADGGENRSYIYNSKVIEQDITCLNGYIHMVDKVILTPQNMAEVLRQNGLDDKYTEDPKTSTKYFSLLLERFSAPYYDYDLTDEYRRLNINVGTDSVFQKRYIADRSQNAKISVGPDNKSLGVYPSLTYDPGWNQYAVSTTTLKENDMAAMFVPNDESMENYFLYGGGITLMNRYATKPNTKENLAYNLSQIPLDIVQPLMNNLMKDSFNESVPSKYHTIMNDAQDQMFDMNNADYATEDNFKQRIVKVMLANNGVIYVMDRVITPADYASVIAPSLYSTNTQVVKAVVRADDNYIEGSSYANAPLQKYYSTYLKAMQSHFSFFVPTDGGLSTYGLVDPMSIASNTNFKYWRFEYKNTSNAILPIRTQAYNYNMEVGQQPGTDLEAVAGGVSANKSEPNGALSAGAGLIKKTLLVDMIDQHIIVHDASETEGMNSGHTYFTARSGAPVVVLSKGDVNNNGLGMVVNGGFQVQLKSDAYAENDHDCHVTEAYDMTEKTNGYGNGMTYLLDRPMQPTTRSLYNVLFKDPEHYSEFYNLCMTSFPEEDLILLGLKKEDMSKEEWTAEQNKYRIFTNASGFNPAQGEQLIRFFNNYRYTVYAPTNTALQNAYSLGLPTYDDIHNFIEGAKIPDPDNEGEYTMTPEDQEKGIAMLNMLVNFVKYHFQDESFYVDSNVPEEDDYQTSCIDNEENLYIELHMKRGNDGSIVVTGKDGASANVIAPFNVLARDANFDNSPAKGAYSFKNTSFVVVHQIDNVLNFKTMEGGRYDAAWATPKKARAFNNKYGIRK